MTGLVVDVADHVANCISTNEAFSLAENEIGAHKDGQLICEDNETHRRNESNQPVQEITSSQNCSEALTLQGNEIKSTDPTPTTQPAYDGPTTPVRLNSIQQLNLTDISIPHSTPPASASDQQVMLQLSTLPSSMQPAIVYRHQPASHPAMNDINGVSAQKSDRRGIKLRLLEERRIGPEKDGIRGHALKNLFKRRSQSLSSTLPVISSLPDIKTQSSHDMKSASNQQSVEALISFSPPFCTSSLIERGNISVSWFEGTGTAELQEHMRSSVCSKINLGRDQELENICIIDESADPPEGEQCMFEK